MLSLLALLACSGSNTDCEELAIKLDDGTADPCDVQACEACDEACAAPCAILESFPPIYACEGGESFSVYDFCEEWDGLTSTTTPSLE